MRVGQWRSSSRAAVGRGEWKRLRRWPYTVRHCEDYLGLVQHSVAHLCTNHDDQALAFLDAEIDNLRGALRWALQAAPETSLRLAGQLGNYWQLRADHIRG